MDRNIVYPGAIPLDTDILSVQRNVMVALGSLAQAAIGTTTIADGLACTQQTVPNMTFNVGPGSIFTLSTVDANAYGSLAADTTDPLVKFGVNLTTTVLTVTAPGTTGQSINYLVQAAFQESDNTAVVLPYYNSANPAVAFSGPANSGAAQNTARTQRVNVSLKAGTPATTGTQSTPAPDSGFVGLYVVTVAFAQTSVVTANIVTHPNAPFIGTKLNGLRRKLTGNLTLFVNGTTGSDSNNGFATTTAFQTLNGAWNAILANFDLAGFQITVNVANGNYGPGAFGGVPVGAGNGSVSFIGNTTTPSNCLVSAVNGAALSVFSSAQVGVAGFKVTATGTGSGQGLGLVAVTAGSQISITGNMELGSCAVADMQAGNGGQIAINANYSISGTSGSAFLATAYGTITSNASTITLTGTPAFSGSFAQAINGNVFINASTTFTGTATGQRYLASFGGFVNTNTGSTTFLPGSVAGVSTTGYYN